MIMFSYSGCLVTFFPPSILALTKPTSSSMEEVRKDQILVLAYPLLALQVRCWDMCQMEVARTSGTL